MVVGLQLADWAREVEPVVRVRDHVGRRAISRRRDWCRTLKNNTINIAFWLDGLPGFQTNQGVLLSTSTLLFQQSVTLNRLPTICLIYPLSNRGHGGPLLNLVVHVLQPPVVLHLVDGAVQVRIVGIGLRVLVPATE